MDNIHVSHLMKNKIRSLLGRSFGWRMGALREEFWKESVGEVGGESFTEFIQVMVFFLLSGVEQSG